MSTLSTMSKLRMFLGASSASERALTALMTFFCFSCCMALSPAWAQSNLQSTGELSFLVNEGASYRQTEAETRERYKPIAADLSRLLRVPVNIVIENDYKKIAPGLNNNFYDIAYLHPAHIAIAAIKNSQYRLLALTKGFTDYRAHFLVTASSPIQSLNDFKSIAHKGKEIIAPAQDSITSVIARATLNELLGTLPLITYTQFQDAVPFSLEHGIAAVGVSASVDIVKAWQAKGGRVIHTSKPVPVKLLLSSRLLTQAQHQIVTEYFIALSNTELGRKKLTALTVEGFVPFDEKALLAMAKWLGI